MPRLDLKESNRVRTLSRIVNEFYYGQFHFRKIFNEFLRWQKDEIEEQNLKYIQMGKRNKGCRFCPADKSPTSCLFFAYLKLVIVFVF